MSDEQDKRCGTRRWWKQDGKNKFSGSCRWPMFLPVAVHATWHMTDADTEDCPTWAAKEDKR